MTGDADREQGVEFGAMTDELAGVDFPATGTEVVDAAGDATIGLPGGETTVAEVLDRTSARSYESPDALRRAVLANVDMDAVGRPRYSDRGGTTPEGADSPGHSL
ncbi:MAG: hypothetical protein ABEJ04_01355 [Halobacteriaceae archaeon]